MAVIISESDMQFGEYDENQGRTSCILLKQKQLVLGSCQQIVQPKRLKSIMHIYTILH